MRPSVRTLSALLAAAVLAPACKPPSANAEAEVAASGARRREVPKVRVAPIERREMVQVLETTSVVESEREIRLFPRSAGVVVELMAEEGDRVMADAPLARLDDRDAALAARDAEVAVEEAEQAAREAELRVEESAARVEGMRLSAEQAERDHDRNLQLFEGERASALSRQALETSRLARDNALSEKQQAEISLRLAELSAESSQTALDRSRVALERARLTLSYTVITAPFDAVVAERSIRVGDSVNTGEPAFVLTDVAAIRAVFLRPQEELELFTRTPEDDSSGELAFTATAEAFPGRAFSGAIERISPTIDAESGQFRVTARIEPTSLDGRAQLLPGMLVRMRIVTDRHSRALVVPKRALRREGERSYVLAIEMAAENAAEGSESLVRRRDVDEGYADEEHVEIVAVGEYELEPGTLVVSIGSRDLEDGDPVSIDDPTPPGPSQAADEAAVVDVGGGDGEANTTADDPVDGASGSTGVDGGD